MSFSHAFGLAGNRCPTKKKRHARNLEQVLAKAARQARAKVQQRAAELATLKDLRHAVERTQEELATALGVGQDTISRLEQRSDMLLSTLKRYVEAMGGKLDLVAKFPNRPPVIIEQIAERRGQQKQSAKGHAPANDTPPKSSDVARSITPV